jgi:hypothetical protein
MKGPSELTDVDSSRNAVPIRFEFDVAPDGRLQEIYGDGETRAGVGRLVASGGALFDEALDMVDACAATVTRHLRSMPARRPDEVELQLAIKVDGKFGVRIVELTAGAQLQVVLRWKSLGDVG